MTWSGPAFTPVEIPSLHGAIRYTDKLYLTGSCFSEHIARRLLRYKYQVVDNPFGILYNPFSMALAFERIVQQRLYHKDELVEHDGLYHSMDHHGEFSGTDPESVVQRINENISKAHQHLINCAYVFISPGTRKVYRLHSNGQIVGNCHKIPQSQFGSYDLTLEECGMAFNKIYDAVKSISPKAQLIWTISPVRHVRDGLIENQRSKSTLFSAIEHILADRNDCIYFPAYEIMIDQLRDYRYYAKDLIHPSPEAVDIIWQIFSEYYLHTEETIHHPGIEKIHQAMNHRILHHRPEAMATFGRSHFDQIARLETFLPGLNWSAEKEYFTSWFEK